jgi:hypothetical protein
LFDGLAPRMSDGDCWHQAVVAGKCWPHAVRATIRGLPLVRLQAAVSQHSAGRCDLVFDDLNWCCQRLD